ncbi:MAG: hypothetical protein QG594_2102 [Bacteroidota bacterium]|nr:hypothetical protein [Bacteroidota bacterium]
MTKKFKLNKANTELLKESLILIFFTLANYWFWQILKTSLTLCAILIILELAIFKLSVRKNTKKRIIFYSGLIVFCILIFSVFGTKQRFDETLAVNSPTEAHIINQRHGYLAEGLGIFFTNRVAQQYYVNWNPKIGKYLRNVSFAVDPNLYFYRSHPREKAGIDETEKYSPFVIPFFIIGILFLITHAGNFPYLIIYLLLAVFITGFLDPKYILGPILVFPFINIVLYLGLTTTVTEVKKIIKHEEK